MFVNFDLMTLNSPDSPRPDSPGHDSPGPEAALFAPLRPRRQRRDGWTATRRAAFLDALGHSGSFKDAAEQVGISRMSVWRLRVEDPGFDAACKARQREGVMLLRDIAHARARQGLARPIFDAHGTQVGTHLRLDCTMLMFLLTRYDMEIAAPPRGPKNICPAPPPKRAMPHSERTLRTMLAARHREQAAHIMDEIEERLDALDIADLYGTPDVELPRARAAAGQRTGAGPDAPPQSAPSPQPQPEPGFVSERSAETDIEPRPAHNHARQVSRAHAASLPAPVAPILALLAPPAPAIPCALFAPKVTYPLNFSDDRGAEPENGTHSKILPRQGRSPPDKDKSSWNKDKSSPGKGRWRARRA
ncbi:hypothetical protein [Pseudonocardia sp. TMWB2A]|uniref:hypothetical protein n=1 Tax=Pseudonocardia sp. TMWB2A TaxID=687430 RepID=UPI00307E3E57